MPVVEGFESLTRGYLGQDWADEYTQVDDALIDFVDGQSAADVTASIEGFDELLRADLTDQEYYDRWIYGLHSGYDPRDDGLTFREWFTHARDLLRAEAARSTT